MINKHHHSYQHSQEIHWKIEWAMPDRREMRGEKCSNITKIFLKVHLMGSHSRHPKTKLLQKLECHLFKQLWEVISFTLAFLCRVWENRFYCAFLFVFQKKWNTCKPQNRGFSNFPFDMNLNSMFSSPHLPASVRKTPLWTWHSFDKCINACFYYLHRTNWF